LVEKPGNADFTPFARENSTGMVTAQALCEKIHKDQFGGIKTINELF
jgi:hypothetical protein